MVEVISHQSILHPKRKPNGHFVIFPHDSPSSHTDASEKEVKISNGVANFSYGPFPDVTGISGYMPRLALFSKHHPRLSVWIDGDERRDDTRSVPFPDTRLVFKT